MKKINEQTKSFLLYGIEDVIKPKEIYKLDGAILFLVFLFFFLSEFYFVLLGSNYPHADNYERRIL